MRVALTGYWWKLIPQLTCPHSGQLSCRASKLFSMHPSHRVWPQFISTLGIASLLFEQSAPHCLQFIFEIIDNLLQLLLFLPCIINQSPSLSQPLGYTTCLIIDLQIQVSQISISLSDWVISIIIKLMLSFQEQEKVLKPILERETNKHCADCGSHTPTWASLDFGVFVCSNCSGAHRALGPTITRIKSTKLDQWNKDWVENMRIGNLEVNQFWEADSKTATVKKPRSGASLDEHNRYVYDKYVRRKFVTDKTATEPLKAYKASNSHHHPPAQIIPHSLQKPRNAYISQPELQMPSIIGLPKKFSETSAMKKESFNLLDDDHQMGGLGEQRKMKKTHETHKANGCESNGSSTQKNVGASKPDDDQFTDYIEPAHHTAQAHVNTNGHPQVSQPDPSKLSFDELFKQPQLSTAQSQQPTTLPLYTQQPQWSGYGHSNMGGVSYGQPHVFPQGQYVNQFAHNPYIGYAPHNSLHAAYNYNTNFSSL